MLRDTKNYENSINGQLLIVLIFKLIHLGLRGDVVSKIKAICPSLIILPQLMFRIHTPVFASLLVFANLLKFTLIRRNSGIVQIN